MQGAGLCQAGEGFWARIKHECGNLTGVLPCHYAAVDQRTDLEPSHAQERGVILPKSIRDSRAWGAGTEFTVEETKDGVLLRPARLFPPTDLASVAGSLRFRTKPKSVAQMHAAIASEVKRRHDSG